MRSLARGPLAFALGFCTCAVLLYAIPSSARPAAKVQRAVLGGPAMNFHGPGLHHVALKVADFDRTLRFYTQTLGMRSALTWGKGDQRGAIVDTGNRTFVEIWAGGKARAAKSPEPPIFHFALRTGDPDADYRKAIAAGAKSQIAPKDVTIPGARPLKVRIAFVIGLGGESIELFRNERL